MDKHHSGWERFRDWVNGERELPESKLFSILQPPRREPRAERSPSTPKEEARKLRGFLAWYPAASTCIGVLLIGVLLATVLQLPSFGKPENPTNNEVPARYLEKVREETGASNAVTGLILSYRGFDTFGESCVLFLALTSVFMLLLRDEKNSDPQEAVQQHHEELRREAHGDVILRQGSALLIPLIFLYGFYMLLGGHHSPGGGFAGGAILGGGLILYVSAYGRRAIHRFFGSRIFHAVRLGGLLLYAVLFGYYIFTGANGIDNRVPLSMGGLILPIDVAVGLVVASTMYGFYAMFTNGEI